MIQFRCWYCGRRYSVPQEQAGQRRVCGCKQRIRVPRQSGASSRDRRLVDWLIEFAVYGGGGGLLGFLLAVVILSRVRFQVLEVSWLVLIGFTLVGLLAGGLGGERFINWIGETIRGAQQR